MASNLARQPVLVAGGGIGGIAAALALVRRGFAVKRFYDAMEWLYAWRLDNCLAPH